MRFINELDEALSHLVFAGSDIIMCQSFHDPVFQVPVSSLSLSLHLEAKVLTDSCTAPSYHLDKPLGFTTNFLKRSHTNINTCINPLVHAYVNT